MTCHNCHKPSSTVFCSLECACERYSIVMEASDQLQKLLQQLERDCKRLLTLF